MKYAFSFCKIISVQNDKESYRRVIGNCISCNKRVYIKIPENEIQSYIKGNLMQNALKSISVSDREFLISGMCGICFDNQFE